MEGTRSIVWPWVFDNNNLTLNSYICNKVRKVDTVEPLCAKDTLRLNQYKGEYKSHADARGLYLNECTDMRFNVISIYSLKLEEVNYKQGRPLCPLFLGSGCSITYSVSSSMSHTYERMEFEGPIKYTICCNYGRCLSKNKCENFEVSIGHF